VRSALEKTPGVLSAEVSMPDKAVVKFDPAKTTVEKIAAAVKAAGAQYSATVRK